MRYLIALRFLLLIAPIVLLALRGYAQEKPEAIRHYFVDSVAGDDTHSGMSKDAAWQSLSRVEEAKLLPGDFIRFKRGSQFEGTLLIASSGNATRSIVLSDYGDTEAPAPSFTNTEFDSQAGKFGNCIRLQGSFVHVENLYFHHTVAELSGRIGFATMWELGAVYIEKTAHHCVVRNNEFFDCGVGIKSYGEHAVIRDNYIHDCSRILKEWNWGPIGIWLGGDHQDVSHNRIINYSVVDPRINWGPNGYGRGADGSAFEIDDARIPKSNIAIHHNYTRGNQGFLEVTWADLARNPTYRGFRIHHNVSDDFQQFIALWRGAECRIEHNTIIRRRVNANEWGVFNITQHDSKNLVRNNTVVTEKDVVIFNVGKNGNAKPNTVISNNLFYAASGRLKVGLEGPGENAVFGDPHFIKYGKGESDLALRETSPAINQGVKLGYTTDHADTPISKNAVPEIGAFEYAAKQDD
jgi:hypothetical protein